MSELEKLKAELEIEKAKLKALQDQINPPPREPSRGPIDYTEGMSMPRNAMQAMIDAVPESLMREIRADERKPNPVTQASSSPLSTSPSSAQSQPQRKGGWIEPRPLESPPGLKYVDALVDAQDAKDRAELALKLAKARMGKGDVR
jgi:hypothetical protein